MLLSETHEVQCWECVAGHTLTRWDKARRNIEKENPLGWLTQQDIVTHAPHFHAIAKMQTPHGGNCAGSSL